ncbi:MAG: ABC transporter permease [Clostridia bacterium]|nr:ABC transporter permease [Clostridia bacterium]
MKARGLPLRRVVRSYSLVVGGLMVLALFVVAAFAPYVTWAPLDQMDMGARLLPPGPGHPLGTDNFGRDMWTRIAYGARPSVLIAVVSVAASAALGSAVGLVAGYFGGWVDLVLMRIVDIFLGFPVIILALALVAALGPGPVHVSIALVAVFWTQYARVVRASALAEKEREFVEAARAAGAGPVRILVRHVFPAALGPVVVLATLGLGTAIVSESTLSFLGFGVQPPAPSWGWTLAYGMRYLREDPYLSAVPGAAIMWTVLGFNLLGDGLRDLLDPRGLSR